jgi:hypothetical protein
VTRAIVPADFQHEAIFLLEKFWTLQKPILEQLKLLAIPLTPFGRYHTLAGQLRILGAEDFLIDRLYENLELNKT